MDIDANNTNTTDIEAQQEAINQQQKYFKKLETRCESKRSKYNKLEVKNNVMLLTLHLPLPPLLDDTM